MALVGVLAVSGVARAQTPADKTLAETLFHDAKRLMAEKNFAQACPKLVESQKLDPGGGTLMNLASCHLAEGKTATAWAEYSEALAFARRDGHKARIAAATAAIAGIEPNLDRLTIRLAPGQSPTGVVITLDGAPVPNAALDASSPVDPGPHVIGATARGKKPWETKLEFGTTVDRKVVVVPVLDDQHELPPPTAAAPTTPTIALPPPATDILAVPAPPVAEPSPGAAQRRVAGFVVGAVGLASIGVGAGLAIHAISLRSQSTDGCTPGCSPAAVQLNDQARTFANVANVPFAVGLAAVATGIVLVVTGRPSTKSTGAGPHVVPLVGGTGTGVAVRWHL